MARKSARRSRKSSRKSSAGPWDPNPHALVQDQGAQAHSVNVPKRNFLASHVAGVQPSIRRTLAWNGTSSTTVTSGVYTEAQVVLLNSPFDPDVALGGVSASGFAKYMALYSKCFVIAARVKVKFALGGSSVEGIPTGAQIVGATITTSTASIGNLFTAIDAGLSDYQVHNVNPDRGELNLSVDVAKFVDKPDLLDDPQFFCTSAANPSQLIALHTWCFGMTPLSSTQFGYLIEVNYDCIFTDPIPFT